MVHTETYKVLGGLHRQEQAHKQLNDGSHSQRDSVRDSSMHQQTQNEQELFAMLNQMADTGSEVCQT